MSAKFQVGEQVQVMPWKNQIGVVRQWYVDGYSRIKFVVEAYSSGIMQVGFNDHFLADQLISNSIPPTMASTGLITNQMLGKQNFKKGDRVSFTNKTIPGWPIDEGVIMVGHPNTNLWTVFSKGWHKYVDVCEQDMTVITSKFEIGDYVDVSDSLSRWRGTVTGYTSQRDVYDVLPEGGNNHVQVPETAILLIHRSNRSVPPMNHVHQWQSYIGFTESYDFCDCGEKQPLHGGKQ